jgi:MYXO-CTERM domain-containing protein
VRGTLELTLQNEDPSRLAQPDNLFVAPWGDLILCEDAYNGVQHLRALTPNGEIYDLGRNALSSLELAGACTSPDGKTLFVNLQHDAITLAIRGPFPEVRRTSTTASLEGTGCSVGRVQTSAPALAALSAVALSLAKRRRPRL